MKMRIADGFVILSGLLISNLAFAAPEGGVVAAGIADISQSGNITTINQTSPSAVINWHSFDTTAGLLGSESVVFNQPSTNSTVLNRITSGLPTNFAGKLSANGRVFIVNPAGMVFTNRANINAASFIATTSDIKDADFMKGNYKFFQQPGSENASIVNSGFLHSRNNGVMALIAPNVVNASSGMIMADAGTIQLASGVAYVLDFNKDNLITFDVGSMIKNGYVQNKGSVHSVFGSVYMTTNTVEKVLDSVVNTRDINEASTATITNKNEVVLGDNAGVIEVGNVFAPEVKIKADNGIVVENSDLSQMHIDSEKSTLLNGNSVQISTWGFGRGSQNIKIGEGEFALEISWGKSEEFAATTTAGNITLNNSAILSKNIFLAAPQGYIKEGRDVSIDADNLTTLSANGTYMPSRNNSISNQYIASNTVRGGIYLRHYDSIVQVSIDKAVGGQNIEQMSFWEYCLAPIQDLFASDAFPSNKG